MKKILVTVVLLAILALLSPFFSGLYIKNQVDHMLTNFIEKTVGLKRKMFTKKDMEYERGWFSSRFRISVPEDGKRKDIYFHFKHGPVIFSPKGMFIGAGLMTMEFKDPEMKKYADQIDFYAKFGFFKQMSIVMKIDNLDQTFSGKNNVKIKNFLIKLDTDVNFKQTNGTLDAKKVGLQIEDSNFEIDDYNAIVNYNKSSYGATLDNSSATIKQFQYKQTTRDSSSKAKVIILKDIKMGNESKINSGNIEFDTKLSVNSLALNGSKTMSLEIPVIGRKIDAKLYGEFERITDSGGKDIVKLADVATQLINKEPEIKIDKAVLKLDNKTIELKAELVGVPYPKGQQLSILNFMRAFRIKVVLVSPQETFKQLMVIIYGMDATSNSSEAKANVSNTVNSLVQSWIDSKILVAADSKYVLDLEIKNGKVLLNGVIIKN